MEPEKELKELAGSHLGQTAGQLLLPTSQPPASSQLCLIMMLSNQPSCRVTILFWCGKMKQDSGLSRRPGHCTWITKQKCVSFSCGCLQLRRKPTRNNLVNLQLQQAQVGMHRSSAVTVQCISMLMHPPPPQASTRVTAPLLLSNFATFHSGQKCTQLCCKAGRPRKVPPARKLISSLLSDLQTFCQTSTKITFCRGPWTQY